MFTKNEPTQVAEEERTGLVERKASIAPGQKLMMAGTAAAAAAAILFGIAGKYNYFGLFGAPAKPKTETQEEARPISAPPLSVPLGVAGAPAPASYVECQGGLRLPLGMTCPAAPAPQNTAAAAPAAAPVPKEKSAQELLAEQVAERRRKGDVSAASHQPAAVLEARDVGAAVMKSGATLAGASTPQGGTNPLASALSGTVTPSTTAGLIQNPSLTLAKGTLPDCTLLTAIKTDQPGFLKCILSSEVRSMDGKVVLMEPGTTFEGEYTQGLSAGQTSIFTLWTRAVTPKYVTVQLNSPGTDALGRAGTSGYVDNKWFERFAGAVFFSLFEDAKQIIIAKADDRANQQAANNTGNTFNFGGQSTLSQLSNTGSTTKSIVEEMLKQGSQVKPSLYKNQGEIIKIYVARDVDFSSVYELRPAGAQ